MITPSAGLPIRQFLLTLATGLFILAKLGATPAMEILYHLGYPPSAARGSMVLSPDGWFWGSGGGDGAGKIYRIREDGSHWEVVHTFDTTGGANPGGLALDGKGYAWGTSKAGGSAGFGVIYRINLFSGQFEHVTSFTGSFGALPGKAPDSTLTLDANGFLWGTTTQGGEADFGSIFKINTTTKAVTSVYSFGGASALAKGAGPECTLLDDGNGFLWGTTPKGGTLDRGTVFKFHKASGVLTTLVDFGSTSGTGTATRPGGGLTADGAGYYWGVTSGTVFKLHAQTGAYTPVVSGSNTPVAGDSRGPLVDDGEGNFWGVNRFSYSSIFKVNKASGVATQLITFNANSANEVPSFALMPDGKGFLWGATGFGGAGGKGGIFKVNIQTGEKSVVSDFSGVAANLRGRKPQSKLAVDGAGMIWGVTVRGGAQADGGTIFRLDPVTKRAQALHDFPQVNGDYPISGLTADANGNWWGNLMSWGGNSGEVYRVGRTTGAHLSIARVGTPDSSHYISTELTKDLSGNLWGATLSPTSVFKVDPQTGGVTIFPTDSLYTYRPLVLDNAGNLWGVTSYPNPGQIFRVDTATGVTTTAIQFTTDGATNRGANPEILIKGPTGDLWGTTELGGSQNKGTLFRIDPATGVLTTLVELANHPGVQFFQDLAFDAGGNLWGITGGLEGKLVRRDAVSGAITTHHQFGLLNGMPTGQERAGTLTAHPDGNLYGVSTSSGRENQGTIFRVRIGPSPETLVATDVFAGGAQLKGRVNPNAAASNWWFEYREAGGSFTQEWRTPVQSLPAGSQPQSVSRPLTGLVPGRSYEYRLAATNSEAFQVQYGEILPLVLPEPQGDIAITGPAGEDLGGGSVVQLVASVTKGRDYVFTLQNHGTLPLAAAAVSFTGANAADFSLVAAPPANLQPGATTTFTVRFIPPTAGTRQATLQLSGSGVPGFPINIGLSGTAVSKTEDSDGDGLSDAAELELASFGFDWQVPQEELVEKFSAGTAQMDLYTVSQFQALRPRSMMIGKNPQTGKFSLMLDWQRSVNLTSWQDFPLQPSEVSVEPGGDIRLEFNPGSGTEFFRVEMD